MHDKVHTVERAESTLLRDDNTQAAASVFSKLQELPPSQTVINTIQQNVKYLYGDDSDFCSAGCTSELQTNNNYNNPIFRALIV